MHKQGLSEEAVESDFRLGILLQLIALAVHLLMDEEEEVHFILVPFQNLQTACQVVNTAARQEHAILCGLQLQQHIQANRSKALPATQASLPSSALS